MVLIEVDGRGDPAALWPVYDAVFGDQPDEQTWRADVWDRHAARDGFRLAQAFDGDALIGFAYGDTGERGQWWTDNAASVLEPDVADAWLGGHFELVSLGVLAASRRHGIGRRLLRALQDAAPHERLVLQTTADPDDPARRLYGSEGWEVLGPGVGAETVVMGRRGGAL